MKRYRKILLTAFLFIACPLVSHAQSWSNILSPNRAINWTTAGLPPTLPDGETTANVWTPPVRNACTTAQAGTTVPIPSSASIATINSAIAACAAANPTGSYLILGVGTFNVTSTINIFGSINNITLRGSGPMSTILSLPSGSSIPVIAIGAASGAGQGTITSGSNFSVGSTTVTISGQTGLAPVVGQIALINQCDTGSGVQPCSTGPTDNGSLFICGDYNPCQIGGDSTTVYNHEQQTVILTGVTNNGGGSYTLTFNSGLYMPNWAFSSGAIVTWQNPIYDPVGIGLEDLTIYSATPTSFNYLVQIFSAYASWMKGVRIIGTGASFASKIQSSKNFLVFNNYIAAEVAQTSYSAGYSIDTSSDSLLLNNIASVGMSVEYDGRLNNIVTGYNYGRDGFTPYAFNLWSFDHHSFSAFNLYEGNENGIMTEDDTWGTHALNTYFRNYVSGYDAPYAGGSINARGIQIGNYQRFENLVANVVASNQITSYQGMVNGAAFWVQTSDPLAVSTLLRWGNITNILQSSDTPANSGVRFVSSEVPSSLPSPNTSWQNSVPSSHTLPCSFFLPGYTSTSCTSHPNGGTGLSWWKVCTVWTTFPTTCSATQTQPFPTTGPDVTGGPYFGGYSYDVPAQVAWLNLPVDPAYQKSYTITSSSWSSGMETLTISGLPTYNCGDTAPCTLLGPFQLSSVNSACITGATVGPNSEILITNGGASTVVYPLGSSSPDNGSSNQCTGNFLFPDVRQFDERVYMADSSGGGITITPTSFNFGSSPVGTPTATETFVLANSTGGTVTGISWTNIGGNTGDFSEQTATTNCGTSLATGSSCNIVYYFDPTAPGLRSTTLSVTDSAGTQNSALSGTGGPSLTAPSPLQLGIRLSNILRSDYENQIGL